MTVFSKNYNFSESEKKWQEFWQEQQIYKWDENVSREDTFVVDTPPPTVSGQLHVGHVYSYTQTDFIVRFWRMMGKNIFYPIGFDDNGLPTERLVEKQRQIKASSMKREEFIKICQEVVAVEEEKFRTLFNNIALSVDWNLEYQTISPLSCKLSQMSFLDLMQKGEIYRDNQPMLWDPVDQTALAQADIEDKEKLGFMNDIIFRTVDGEELIIATTRPEMLPACVAVFYHPEDDRYNKLEGKFAITPLFNVKVPILPDKMVLQEKGTGLVMCCTFGDQTDILWWKKYKLPTKIIINKAGRIDLSHQDLMEFNREYFNHLSDLKVVEARNKIIEILKEQNLLIKQVEINQSIKCAERSGAPLEILTTPQWFIHTIKHKDILLQRTEELNWHPKTMKIRLENWIKVVAFDWCISRQRFFGVPFPVWYSKKSGEEGKVLLADINQLPVNPLTDLPYGYTRDEVEPDRDVMDTWATSAISPQLSSHVISKEYEVNIERHRKLFPMDLRPQAHEILRTWAFYTILKAHLHESSLPWKNIMISGWCLAEDRTKMSKSKGNVIPPETLLQQYGADVIRYWASTFKLGADTAYSEDIMKNGKRLVNKLWNAAKFVSQHFNILLEKDKNSSLETLHEKISRPIDQWLINELINLINAATEEMGNYEYANAIALIEKFFWSNFCDNYLEITKIRAYNEDKSDPQGQYSTVLTLYHSLQIILKLFAPFLPFITEEIYHTLYGPLSIHAKGSWPKFNMLNSSLNVQEIENFLGILDLVRKSKTEKNLSIKAPIKIIEIKDLNLTDDLLQDLKNVTATEEIKLVKEFLEEGLIMSNSNIKVNIFYP